MALFKRDKNRRADREAAVDPPVTDAEPVESEPIESEPVPQVNISMSTFGAPAAPPTPIAAPAITRPAAPPVGTPTVRPPAEAPAKTETALGLPDNVLVVEALQKLSDPPTNDEAMNVMRQALQGHLFVRVRGDARALLSEGKPLDLAVSEVDGNRFLLAFSGGAGLQASVRADGDTATSAISQPVRDIFRTAIDGPYAGIIVDHATAGARINLPTGLLEKASGEGDPARTVKALLAAPRTSDTAAAVAEALTTSPLWVAAGPSDENGKFGLAESRSPDGTRRLEVFTHPLEIVCMRRGDRTLPITGAQLAKALTSGSGLTGIVVDPAGPWIELSLTDLAPLLELEA